VTVCADIPSLQHDVAQRTVTEAADRAATDGEGSANGSTLWQGNALSHSDERLPDLVHRCTSTATDGHLVSLHRGHAARRMNNPHADRRAAARAESFDADSPLGAHRVDEWC
jgi:hypothetical protein